MDCAAPMVATAALCGHADINPASAAGGGSSKRSTSKQRSDRMAMGGPGVTFGTPTADVFGKWLQNRLATEREIVVSQLQELVLQHVNDHHRFLLDDLEARLEKAPRMVITELLGARRNSLSGAGPNLKCGNDLPQGRGSRRNSGDDEEMFQGSAGAPATRVSARMDNVTSDLDGGCDNWGNRTSAPTKNRDSRSRPSPAVELAKVQELNQSGTSKQTVRMPSTMHGGPDSPVKCIVQTGWFEAVCSIAILMSILIMALEAQYVGHILGQDLKLNSYVKPVPEAWPHADLIFTICLVALTCIYAIELVLRVIDLKWLAIKSGWIWFDFFLLVTGCFDAMMRLGIALSIGVNPAVLRVVRLGRVMRTLKLLRHSSSFQSLFLLIKSLQVSAHTLWWSCMTMFFAIVVFGMIICQLLYGYMSDDDLPLKERQEVFLYFGTFTRMLLTMYEITLGNWSPPKRVLMENVDEWWGAYIVFYRCVLCFGIVSISGAVFVTETTRAAAADKEVAIMNKERATKSLQAKLGELFDELDATGDGSISYEEFETVMFDDEMKKFLGSLQMEVEDAHDLFRLLDDGDGKVQQEEFIRGISHCRGEAKAIDVILLLKVARRIEAKLDRCIDPRTSK